MSETAYSSTRKLLTQHSDLTSLVPTSNIKVGWNPQPDSYPYISIFQVGGSSYAYLGRGSSPLGSKMRKESRVMQIDIFSRSGTLNLQLIADQVELALISGTGFRKVGDNDDFDDETNTSRKIQTWTFWENVDD